MAAAHGSDFVRVRPYGAKGDKGCDGYLLSTGTVLACYGAVNAAQDKVDYLIKKMGDDFEKANFQLKPIMKEWHMVHNLVDGLPIEAVFKLESLKTANGTLTFGFMGLEAFEQVIFALPIAKIEGLLGLAATTQDALNLQPKELRDLVAGLAHAASIQFVDVTAIRPVPPEKLEYNNLPGHWRSMIAGGWQNTHLVEQHLRGHHDPLIGERIGQHFRARYRYLRAQRLESASIMASLYEYVAGIGLVAPQRQVAAQALLAHLFESCDIFETPPPKAVA